MIKAIVTDIEGTTSSIRFVHDVLFPYSARHLEQFLRDRQARPDVAEQLAAVAETAGLESSDIAGIHDQLQNWIASDTKATPLKALQGMIWQEGYEKGAFKGHVYADAAEAIQRWASRGIRLFVYSSGSVAAQRLIFGYSEAGDLTPCFEGYFDTRIGHKKEPASYQTIQQTIGLSAEEILFLSDVPAELEAAHEACLGVMQLVRGEPVESQDKFPIVADFSEISV